MISLIQLIFPLIICSLISSQPPYQPKLKNGDPCLIPFEYNGKVYHDCTTEGDPTPWCRPDNDKWDYCGAKPDFGACKVAPPTANISEVQSILDLVNNIRAAEPALRMAKLKWNSELAQRAQYMSNQCKLGSDDTKLCTSSSQMGQISYVTYSSEPQPKKWSQFILEFYGKKATYDIDTNKCSAQYCNGYKQLVNAQTIHIGCAATSCKQDTWFADYYFCNFHPPIYSGKPYDKGDGNCDSCHLLGDYSFRCSNKLCEICDKPGPGCKGKEERQKEIDSGKVCDDTDTNFCQLNLSVCPHVNLLPAEQKALMTSKCKKTCKLCT